MKIYSGVCKKENFPVYKKCLETHGFVFFRAYEFPDDLTGEIMCNVTFNVPDDETELMLKLKFPPGLFREHKWL